MTIIGLCNDCITNLSTFFKSKIIGYSVCHYIHFLIAQYNTLISTLSKNSKNIHYLFSFNIIIVLGIYI